MRVTVRLFARLKDIAGAPELERDVPADATLADVWAQLAHDFPAMAPYRGSVSGARNAEYARHGRRRRRWRRNCVSATGVWGIAPTNLMHLRAPEHLKHPRAPIP